MYSLVRAVSYPRSQGFVPHAALRCSTAGFDDTYTRGLIRMKLDVPHGLHRLPPAPELRRTQDTANPSHKEHIYLYVLCGDHYCPIINLLVATVYRNHDH